MEDDSLNIINQSQSLRKVVVVITELINRIFSDKLSGFSQGQLELNQEGKK